MDEEKKKWSFHNHVFIYFLVGQSMVILTFSSHVVASFISLLLLRTIVRYLRHHNKKFWKNKKSSSIFAFNTKLYSTYYFLSYLPEGQIMSIKAAPNFVEMNNTNVASVPPICRVHHRATPPNSSGSKKNQQEAVKSSKSSSISGCESIIRFLSLPRQTGVVLLLEFLNSFRILGLRFVLFNYVTNEYGISDTYAGKLLGIKGMVDVIFGLVGSILVDLIGVRKVSIVALSVAIIGRSLLAFGRTNATLIAALLVFSPCGEAMLSMGLYRVALKKLTTPLTRPLAFAVSYAASNLSGALADVVVDRMRSLVKDLEIDRNLLLLSGVYTPIRQFIVSCTSSICTLSSKNLFLLSLLIL